jgi:hypothetical protein
VRGADGSIAALCLPALDVCAAHYVFAAGTGNETLVAPFGESSPPMQRRPLRQVIVRHTNLPVLYAHCVPQLPKVEPRLTVTTHIDAHGQRLWYLGGQLASDGVERSDEDQARHARAELTACLPWIDLSGARIESLCVDRAEPRQSSGRRPDEAFVAAVANALICWPTKLALTPDLGDKVLAQLRAPSGASDNGVGDYAAPRVAEAPWDR